MRKRRAGVLLVIAVVMLLQHLPLSADPHAGEGHCGVNCACPIGARPEAPAAAPEGAHCDKAREPASCWIRARCGSGQSPVDGAAWTGPVTRPALLDDGQWRPTLAPEGPALVAPAFLAALVPDNPPTPPPRSLRS